MLIKISKDYEVKYIKINEYDVHKKKEKIRTRTKKCRKHIA